MVRTLLAHHKISIITSSTFFECLHTTQNRLQDNGTLLDRQTDHTNLYEVVHAWIIDPCSLLISIVLNLPL
jgi:hypothetical protein